MATPLTQSRNKGYAQICQSCWTQAPTKYVEFYQNIGVIIMRFHKSIKGNLCKSCINKYFWEFTAINALLGWWGVISFIVTPFFILNNVIRYLGSLGMESNPNAPPSQFTASQRALNFILLAFGGTVVWGILLFLDFLLRADSYYFNPKMNPVQGVFLGTGICLGAWLMVAALIAFVLKR